MSKGESGRAFQAEGETVRAGQTAAGPQRGAGGRGRSGGGRGGALPGAAFQGLGPCPAGGKPLEGFDWQANIFPRHV